MTASVFFIFEYTYFLIRCLKLCLDKGNKGELANIIYSIYFNLILNIQGVV